MNKKGLIIVDYQNTFADPQYKNSPRELYVDHWETLANTINQCIDQTKQEWWTVLASREIHDAGHMFFASCYRWKLPITKAPTTDLGMWILTLKEIQNWTEEENGFTETAAFSVDELKAIIMSTEKKEILLWPDHCVKNTRGAKYYDSLNSGLIDQEVIKWRWVTDHPYTWFGGSNSENESLLQIIEWKWINEVDVVWLATDYCVHDTVMDALKYNLKTNLIIAWSAGVYPVWTYNAIKTMENAGANIV
jgi:nicotinamidase-related amidase